MSPVRTICAVAALLAPAIYSAAATADVFGPSSLVSASAVEGFSGNQQADFARDAAISADGRYVAFDGSFGGRNGVWRRDLQSGAVEAVAVGEVGEAISAPYADLPSISDDGRFVSFTTTARLDPLDDTNAGPDVYVRDMTVAASQPCEAGQQCAYTLASAIDGSSAGLTYEPGDPRFGALAAGRTALSGDGRKVAFVTTAISNLAGAGTPALQVAVRDLDTQRTELVSVRDDPATGQPLQGQPVSRQEGSIVYGAVYPGKAESASFADPQAYEQALPIGASISADGSTVAWMGVDIAEQARMLSAEAPQPLYSEPLWRRIADGPQAPIRRVTGGSDPANPACAASAETALPGTPSLSDPCQGPFAAAQRGRTDGIWSGALGDVVPRLSADGYSVVFLAQAPLAALGEDFGGSEVNSDLYLADMHEGLTRAQALRPLTELASADQRDLSENGPIEDLGISADGEHVAFTTKRTVFPLGSPAYISASAAIAGMLELFAVDLSDDTLTRVTEGFEGGASEHPHTPAAAGEDPYTHAGDGALSPSMTGDGTLVAFSSTAANLAFGDGNTPPVSSSSFDGADAFIVTRKLFPPTPTPQAISPQPPPPTTTPAWRLGVTARSRADGSVLLYVTVPGAGRLGAAAQSTIRLRIRHRGRVRTTVATRSIAASHRAAHASALLTMVLTLSPRYRALAAKAPGLAGSATVTFVVPGRKALRQSVRVTFLRKAKQKARSKAKPKASSVRSPGGAR
jgi:hypothetical protein